MRTLTALALLFSHYLCLAQTGKIEPVGPPTNSAVPQGVQAVLETSGHHLLLEDGSVACDIWLRKGTPVQAKKDVADALYPELAESTLVGLISFRKDAIDYRGQAVKSGIYTLRYELIPDDGNHLGVAPNRDFVLLIPAESDPDPNANFKFDELVNLSRKATGTRHPAPLCLTQPASAPGLSRNEEDHWIFTSTLKLDSGKELPFALVVRGTAPQ